MGYLTTSADQFSGGNPEWVLSFEIWAMKHCKQGLHYPAYESPVIIFLFLAHYAWGHHHYGVSPGVYFTPLPSCSHKNDPVPEEWLLSHPITNNKIMFVHIRNASLHIKIKIWFLPRPIPLTVFSCPVPVLWWIVKLTTILQESHRNPMTHKIPEKASTLYVYVCVRVGQCL